MAYKWVATAMMVGQVNLAVERLDLPLTQPVIAKQVDFIAPPRLMGFGGSLIAKPLFFGFADRGLFSIVNQKFYSRQFSIMEHHERHAARKSLIDTNQAYQLAKEWLRTMDVNLPRLEAECDTIVSQRFYYLEGGEESGPLITNGPTASLPIFDVEWKARKPPAHRRVNKTVVLPSVSVAIYGPTKELMQLRLDDTSFSNWPTEPVKDIEALLAIPDKKFVEFTEHDRQRLLDRHLATPLRPTERAHEDNRSPSAKEK